jgi:hypothetical protein
MNKPTYEELAAQVNHLKIHLNEIIMVAQRCDSWESFPQKPLDVASTALEAAPAACLEQVKYKTLVDEAMLWPENKYTECSHVRESILKSAEFILQGVV